MMTSRTRRGALAASAVSIAVALAAAPSAQATRQQESHRISGATRYETAEALYAYNNPVGFAAFDGCGDPSLVIASGEDYHDALAANFLAGQSPQGGMLLTQNSQLTPATSSVIHYCNTLSQRRPHIWVVDGGAQITDSVVSAVTTQATGTSSTPKNAERVHGADAITGAVTVAETAGTQVDSTQAYGRVAIVASADNFPDALAASPLVYSQHIPLLYTHQNALPGETVAALKQLKIQTVLLLGGPAAVSTSVEQQLGATAKVVRIYGSNRQLTATAVADVEIKDFGFVNDGAQLVRGDDYPDALAGGQYAGGGVHPEPLLLTSSPTVLGGDTTAYLSAHATQLGGHIGVIGGTAAVSDTVWHAAQKAGGEQ